MPINWDAAKLSTSSSNIKPDDRPLKLRRVIKVPRAEFVPELWSMTWDQLCELTAAGQRGLEAWWVTEMDNPSPDCFVREGTAKEKNLTGRICLYRQGWDA